MIWRIRSYLLIHLLRKIQIVGLCRGTNRSLTYRSLIKPEGQKNFFINIPDLKFQFENKILLNKILKGHTGILSLYFSSKPGSYFLKLYDLIISLWWLNQCFMSSVKFIWFSAECLDGKSRKKCLFVKTFHNEMKTVKIRMTRSSFNSSKIISKLFLPCDL